MVARGTIRESATRGTRERLRALCEGGLRIEDRDELVAALNRLRPRYRQALVLYGRGHAYEDIAARMGTSLAGAKMTVGRAVRGLERELSGRSPRHADVLAILLQ